MGTKLSLSAAAAAFIGVIGIGAYSGGPPVRRTGAPGEKTCLDAGCHSGERFDDSGALILDTGTELTYIPGGPRQQWVLRVNDPLARAYGFQMTARTAASGEQAGDFVETDSTTQIVCETDQLKSPAGCGPVLQYTQHNQPRTTGEFVVDWTPPATLIGDVFAHVAANASVAGQRNARIHFRRFVLKPATSLVLNAASMRTEVASGSWVSIFGSGLASSSRTWRDDEIVEGRLPSALDGTRVSVNGRAAAVSYISPRQINVQLPDDPATGEVAVEVRNGDRLVANLRAIKHSVAPALFTYESAGRRYAAAIHPDGALLTTRASRPGDTILIYANGFGSTLPAVASGRVFHGAAPIAGSVRVSIGALAARVDFAGLVGAGLYQLNVVVPDLAPGDHLVKAQIEGFETQPGVFLPIAAPR